MSFVKCSVDGCNRKLQPILKVDPRDRDTWLYRECDLLVAASHEDFGLTPLEAATFRKPSVVLRWGGFVDTVRDGETGLFFEAPTAQGVAAALRAARTQQWRPDTIRAHADRFSERRFIERVRAIAGVTD